MVRLPVKERRSRLLTRRRNALLAAVEAYVLAEPGTRDSVALARAMEAYVQAKYPRRRKPVAAVESARILSPELAHIIFGLVPKE